MRLHTQIKVKNLEGKNLEEKEERHNLHKEKGEYKNIQEFNYKIE